jgi:hypothetical protein
VTFVLPVIVIVDENDILINILYNVYVGQTEYVPPFDPVIVGVSLSLVVVSCVHCELYGPISYVSGA